MILKEIKDNVKKLSYMINTDEGKQKRIYPIKYCDTDEKRRFVKDLYENKKYGNMLYSRYFFIKYFVRNYMKCPMFLVRKEFFNPIQQDIERLHRGILNKNQDNDDFEGIRSNGLKGDYINSAVLGFPTVNSVALSSSALSTDMADLGHIGIINEVKLTNMFCGNTHCVETCHSHLSDESLIINCKISELKNCGVDVSYLGDYDEIYIFLGIATHDVLNKYLNDKNIDLKSIETKKSKKYLPKECYNNLIPFVTYYDSFSIRSNSHIHALNGISNLDFCKFVLQNQIAVFEDILKRNSELSDVLSELSLFKEIKGKVKNRKKMINKSLVYPLRYSVIDMRTQEKSQDMNKYKNFYYELLDVSNKKLRNKKFFVYDVEKVERSNKYNGEDVLFENGFFKNVIIGQGIRAILNRVQLDYKSGNKDIEKSVLFLDFGDIGDAIDYDLSCKYKEIFLKPINNKSEKDKTLGHWDCPILACIIIDKIRDNKIPFEISKIVTCIRNLFKTKMLSSEDLNELILLPNLYAEIIGLNYYIEHFNECKTIVNQYFPSILYNGNTQYNYTKDIDNFIKMGKLPQLNIYPEDIKVVKNIDSLDLTTYKYMIPFDISDEEFPYNGVVGYQKDNSKNNNVEVKKNENTQNNSKNNIDSSNLKYPNDPFMNREIVKERLRNEFRKYGELIIAYDFDYTVHNYQDENYSYEFVVNLLRLWRPYANYIVFTASPEYRFKYIKDYLTKNNIPFDTINSEILERHYTRKVYYNVFLDDRAGLGEISEILMELYKEIESGELKKE